VNVGIFVAHADGTILLATHPIIASEFNDLANSTWLITGFTLAGAATQALVLSNQYKTTGYALYLTDLCCGKVRQTQRYLWPTNAGYHGIPHFRSWLVRK
jgi:uncharacterized RDD family membrane protein YckC